MILNVSGKLFNPFDLKQNDFENIDKQLATTLPRIQRFSAQLRQNYSVAQHCLSMVEFFRDDVSMQRIALSHELFEGLGLGDIPSPIKDKLPQIKEAENRALELFANIYGLDYELYNSKEFKEADLGLLVMEALNLAVKSDFDWTSYSKPLGKLYKLNASEEEITKDFLVKWQELFKDTKGV